MDIKTSTKACEGFIAEYVGAANKLDSSLVDAVVATIDHAFDHKECSLFDQLGTKVTVWGNGKTNKAFKELRKLCVPFHDDTKKMFEAISIEKCASEWTKHKELLRGSAEGGSELSLTEWFEEIKGTGSKEVDEVEAARKAAAKKDKIFNEVLAERRLHDPVYAHLARVEKQLRELQETDSAQAAAMIEGFVKKLGGAISGKLKQDLADAS